MKVHLLTETNSVFLREVYKSQIMQMIFLYKLQCFFKYSKYKLKDLTKNTLQ